MIAALTGLRRGEILALRWSDIDLEKRFIYVRQNIVMGVIDTPKSNTSRRVVGISDKLHAALLNLQLSAPEGSEFIFLIKKEGNLYDAPHISRIQFHKAIKAAGITKKIRFHDLRHSFATLLKNQGVHRNDIQGVVGHSSATVTDIYMHLMPEIYSKIASTAEDAIFSE
ncbi:MAG: site-specific integrase [Actinobacteria bacterium]|nr:site-specific integrase [Actinomycetota bacterium]